jgi:Family of unknown function (DUF6262)
MSNDTRQRTMQLLAVRRQVSADKRARVTAVIAEMLARGIPITAASVARAAGCSTWLVYSPGLREHLDHARQQQATNGLADPASEAPPSTAGLRIDLVLARQEIARLRDENRLLHHRLERQLGAQLDRAGEDGVREQLAELETTQRQLVCERDRAQRRVVELGGALVLTQDELAAARDATRQMMRHANLE